MKRPLIASAAIAILLAVVLLLGAFGLAQRMRTAPPAAAPVQIEARSNDGKLIAIARNSDSSVRLINARTHKTIFISHLGDHITSLRFSSDASHLDATVRDDSHLRAIDTRTGAILALGER